MTKCTQEQLRFHPSNGKTIRADFNGGELSSDFGALLLRETMLHSGIISRLANAIDDKRHQSYINHTQQELIAQRVLRWQESLISSLIICEKSFNFKST